MKNLNMLFISLLSALVLFIILSVFYGQNNPKELSLNEPIQIVLKSTAGQPMDFWDVVGQGIEQAAKEYGIQVEISGPRYEKEINRQINILNRIIAADPPLIILAASDYKRLVKSVEQAESRKIPIITLDSAVDSKIPVSFIATDNLEAGRRAGAEMKRLIAGRSKKEIAIVSHIRETATAIDREAGVREALEGEKIAGTWFCDVEQEKAYRITLRLLKNPEIGGIVALNEVAALGVARAIDETGSKDEMIVVGFDSAIRELSYLEEGVIKATVVQRPYNMGYLSVQTAAEYLLGRRIESFIDTGSVLITRENMFKREYQELLYPFNPQE
ncbi:MAG: substrate-binding domain-containing protein [Spirochaetales bacterium]|nr:substrate-binding domain-containing protein [Spirochaetales bacterium]